MRFMIAFLVSMTASTLLANDVTENDFQDFVGDFRVEKSECAAFPASVSIKYEARQPSDEEGRWIGPHALVVAFSSPTARYRKIDLSQFTIIGEGRFSMANFSRDSDVLTHKFQSDAGTMTVSLERADENTIHFKQECRGQLYVCYDCSLMLKRF